MIWVISTKKLINTIQAKEIIVFDDLIVERARS